MFANIRRHQKWLWILISGAVIVSFVWYFNPNVQYGGGGGRGGAVGTMDGRAVSQREYEQAYYEAGLRHFFSYGSWPGRDEFSRQMNIDINRDARTRLILKEKIKQYNIHVTPAETAKWIAEVFRDKDSNSFDPENVKRFVQNMAQYGVKKDDFERYVQNEVAIMHLANVAGATAKLVTPQEAEEKFREENRKVAADLVQFQSSNFVAQVQLDPAAIATYYTNMQAMYRLPDRRQVAFVEFAATNYFPQADAKIATITNLQVRIDEEYVKRGPNYYMDTNGQAMPPEKAKTQIRETLRKETALIEARRAAAEFAQELFDLPGDKQIANLENLAAAKGLKVQTTEPFSQREGPREIEVPQTFTDIAFQLSPGDPFASEPILGSDGVYVFGLKKIIPSEQPPFETVQARVTEQYKTSQAQRLAQEAGRAFQAAVTNAIAQGKSFKEAAEANGQQVTTMSPFSQTTRSIPELDFRADFASIKNTAFSLSTNQVSSFTPTRDGGFVVFVKEFIPVSDEQVKAEMPAYITKLQTTRQNDAFNAWFAKEMANTKLVLAGDERQKAEGGVEHDHDGDGKPDHGPGAH